MGLDREPFLARIESGEAERAFQADLKMCRDFDVTGFPSYEVHVPGGEEIAMFGFPNFAAFEGTFQRLAGDRLHPMPITTPAENLAAFTPQSPIAPAPDGAAGGLPSRAVRSAGSG